jgi:hypothetical protein
MQKDYWNISKRNFRAMAIISVIFAILFGLTASDSPVPVQNALLLPVAVLFITFVVSLVIASLFKKHSPMAIKVGYLYVGLVFIYDLIAGFILGSPTSGIAYKVLGLLVLAYLFVNIYMASKQTVSPVS